jgi:SAM-dependent MidA family methyltransferase
MVDTSGNSLTLSYLIADRITESFQHRLTFAAFMDLALYHPQQGYYATRARTIGARGDFLTAPHLGPDFGELLAAQFVEMWQRLDCPERFTLVEMGPGQGILAQDILREVQQRYPAFCRCLTYILIERSSQLIACQRQLLQPLMEQIAIEWRGLDDLASGSIVGCVFSNELVDAFPVHQVVVESGELREIYVTTSSNEPSEMPFQEITADLSTPQLSDYFSLVGIDLLAPPYPEGYRTEVNLAALGWMQTVADRLERGYVLTIDYGYPSQRYYHPARSQGTLQCYWQQSYHSNPYIHVGQQDITAHVDFTALERTGEKYQLQPLGLVPQGLFLMALGLGDRIAALSQPEAGRSLPEILQRRDSLHRLMDMNPNGMGNFKVLIQGKNLRHEQPLRGLSVPE